MSSIKETSARMRNQVKGLTDEQANSDPGTLQGLKSMLDSMYAVRSSGAANITTLKTTHKNYVEFQGSIGRSPGAMSTGDYNLALDNMATCTCDSRSSAGCVCVSVNQGDACTCNSRVASTCDCVSRGSGKYDVSCSCNSVFVGCSCESRSATYSCSCDSRCSCNTVREFS